MGYVGVGLRLSHIKFHKHVRRKSKEIDQLEGPILDRDWSISLRLRLTCLWNFMCDGLYAITFAIIIIIMRTL